MLHMVRFEKLVPGRSVEIKVRPVPPLYIREHGALCRAFGLDPVRAQIDVPSTWGGPQHAGRIQQAMVFWHETADKVVPIGHMTIMREGERTVDGNPTDPRDHYNLSNRM